MVVSVSARAQRLAPENHNFMISPGMIYAVLTFKVCDKHVFIGPESDHWLCLSLTDSLTNSLTNSLTHSCLVNLIDVTLASEDDNSKLVEVVTVAHVDDEKT